jgi:hypothetical protein
MPQWAPTTSSSPGPVAPIALRATDGTEGTNTGTRMATLGGIAGDVMERCRRFAGHPIQVV